MKRKTREEKAITLIALIITIVVLLILAVVAINAVTGDGIIQHAVNAKEDYGKAQAKENGILAYYEQYLTTQSGLGPWKQDGDNVYMTNSEGNKVILRIGDKVEYDEGYDEENLKTTTLDSEFKMDNLDWRVLGINKNGQLELISTQPTEDSFDLEGEDGYLNGPAKLNKVCNDLYSTELATARSLNADDINKLAGIITEEDKKRENDATDYGNWYRYKYDATAGKIQYSKSTDYNPETKEGTWTNYENTEYEIFKEPGKTEIINSGNTKIAEIKYTFYSYGVSDQINSETTDGIRISGLITNGLSDSNDEVDTSFKVQWLAETCVLLDECATFSIRSLNIRGRITGAGLVDSNNVNLTKTNEYVIRPVVTLKSGVQIVDTDNNGIPNVK